MAFPYDGRYFSFAAPPASELVESAFLNALQDAILEAIQPPDEMLYPAVIYPGASPYEPAWVPSSDTEQGFVCLHAERAVYSFSLKPGTYDLTVAFKYFNNHGSARAPAVALYKAKPNNADVPPALGAAIWTNVGGETIDAGKWSFISSGAPTGTMADVTVATDDHFLVVVGVGGSVIVGDKVAVVKRYAVRSA